MQITIAGPGRCTRTLKPGEAKRVLHAGPLVGFYVACPTCGWTVIVTKDDQTTMTEGAEGLTFSPGVACRRCHRHVSVTAGQFDDV